MILDRISRLWDHLRGRRHGDWMWTADGTHVHPLDPDPATIRVANIARGLATECRYAGHVRLGAPYPFYSVAEHAILVSHFAGIEAYRRGMDADALEAQRWGLHHDDTEAFIGDVIRPLKYQREMREFRRAEHRIERAVMRALDLRPSRAVVALVDEVDSRLLVDEIDQVIAFPDMDRVRRKFGEPLGARVRFLDPVRAEQLWLEQHAALEYDRALSR